MGRINGGEHFGEEWITWSPSWSCSGTMTYGGAGFAPTVLFARYRWVIDGIEVRVRAYGATAVAASNAIFLTLPTGIVAASTGIPLAAHVRDASSGSMTTATATTSTVSTTGDAIVFLKRDATNFGLGANRYVGCNGVIEV